MDYYATYISKSNEIYKYCKELIDNNENGGNFEIGNDHIVRCIIDYINTFNFNLNLKPETHTVEMFVKMTGFNDEPTFPPHHEKDEYPDTFTFCCYVCNTGTGGELALYEDGDELNPTMLISTKDTETQARVIMFNDKIMHGARPIYNGKRTLVSFHFNVCKNYHNF